jgi:superfamily II DNA or RNA helicase
MRPVVDGSFSFSANDFSSAELAAHEKSLRFNSLSGEKYGFGESQTVNLLARDGDLVRVPRRYAYSEFSEDLLLNVDVMISSGVRTDVVFDEVKQSKIPELKVRQDAVIDEFLSRLEELKAPFKGGILSAPCGTGKTVMASKIIARLGVSSVVLVHKEFLCEQWRERLSHFLNLNIDDIGLVQQDTCDFENKKIVIAMIQSLIDNDKYSEDFYRWPGVVFIDETHRMGAPQFQSVIPKFPAKYRIGLTATPRRGDGLQPVFELHIGKVLATMSGGNALVPDIYQKKFDIYIPDNLYCVRDNNNEISKIFTAKLINLLVGSPKRNAWIVSEVLKAAGAERKIIVLSDRIDHLRSIGGVIEADGRFGFGYYIGGMSEEERSLSASKSIILASFQMAKEGLDIPDIDTLFLTTPKSDVEQSVGRILRAHSGKKSPVVVDIVDTLPFCMSFAKKRLNQYNRLKWPVKHTCL